MIKESALELVAEGVDDCEIARRLGVPRTTVRDWRRPRYEARVEVEACARCWCPSRPVRLTPSDYAELLGLYLGDGHITILDRTQRLRLFLDSRHARVVDEAEALVGRCLPVNRVTRVHNGRRTMVR